MVIAIQLFLLFITILFLQNDSKTKKELQVKCIELEMENNRLKLNPLKDVDMVFGFRLEEIRELRTFCDKKGGLCIHNLLDLFDEKCQRIEELEQQNDFECGCVSERDEIIKEANKIISKLYYALSGKDHLSEQNTKVLVEAHNFIKKEKGNK